MSKKSIFMMLAVFVVGIAAVLFLPKTVQADGGTEVKANGFLYRRNEEDTEQLF